MLLRDASVERWDARAGEPWDDAVTPGVLSAAPFQYLTWLRAQLRGGGELLLAAGDPGQGLQLHRDLSDWGSGVVDPSADVSTLPVGAVERVRLHVSGDGSYPMVVITIDGRDLAVLAGDVVEGEVVWNDEELLVFEDIAAIDRVSWSAPPEVCEVVEVSARESRRWRRR